MPFSTVKVHPREGFTKRTLPMLPVVPPLTRVPLEIARTFRSGVPDTIAPALHFMVEYNQHLGFQEGLDDDTRMNLSENVGVVIENINRIGEQAQKEMQDEVERLGQAVQDFVSYVQHGQLNLRDPTWAGATSPLPLG